MSIFKLSAGVMAILLTVTLSGAAVAKESVNQNYRVGGSDGSGTDGLTYQPINPAPDEVVLNVPSAMTDFGKIKLIGEPGPGQPSFALAIPCEVVNGKVTKSGCKGVNYLPLNKAVELRAGYYLITYSYMMFSRVVEITREMQNRPYILNMKMIALPKEANGTQIRVFVDYSAAEEQEKLINWFWSYTPDDEYDLGVPKEFDHRRPRYNPSQAPAAWYVQLLQTIRTHSREVDRYYQYLNDAKNPQDLSGLFKFNDDGSYKMRSLAYSDPLSSLSSARVVEMEGQRGRFNLINNQPTAWWVLVFPGVYGIEYTAKDGYVSYEIGRRVQ